MQASVRIRLFWIFRCIAPGPGGHVGQLSGYERLPLLAPYGHRALTIGRWRPSSQGIIRPLLSHWNAPMMEHSERQGRHN